MPWSEAKQYISQVVAFLENSSTEAETLRQIKELRADISSVMMGRESDAKKIIAGERTAQGRSRGTALPWL